jgi:hypothetical protein
MYLPEILLQVAAQLDAGDVLVQIEKNQDELLNEVMHLSTPSGMGTSPETSAGRAIENENRARQRIQIEDVELSGISFGSGSVDVVNGRAPGDGENGSSSRAQRNKDKRPSPAPSPSPERAGGVPTRSDISVKGVYSSGIALGDGDVSVSNW